MTIAALDKITLYGPCQYKENILSQLQSLGCMHLITLNQKKITALTEEDTTLIERIKKAVLHLKNSPEQARKKLLEQDFNADKIVNDALFNQKKLREANDRQDFLEERIKDLMLWGNFQLPDLHDVHHHRLWFYKMTHKEAAKIQKNLIVQEIYRNNQFIYIVVIATEDPKEDAMPVPRIHTGAIPLNVLRQELKEVNEKIDDLTEERRHLTRYINLLTKELERFADRTELMRASEQTSDKKEFFILQGWVPQQQSQLIKTLCDKQKIAMTVESALPQEIPPTLMQTVPWANAGVELVNFYQTPSYRTLDPSLMVFFSFSIFFAIILADAGYGFIIALFTLFSWKWLGKYNAGVWLKPLLIFISAFSIIYGMLLGSYFGIELPEKSFLLKLRILDIHNFKMMMQFAIVVGCLHLIVANGMRSWYAKTLSVRMQSMAYVMLIIGLMTLICGSMIHSLLMVIIAPLISICSLLQMMIFASDIPIVNFKSLLKRILHGFEALFHLTSLFGDILSYLRLFALGLAGAALAETFNHIASHIAANTLDGHGWILAFIVLLLGQSLNLLLCIMSAVIHGLRLNYIEFFKWSIKEEGTLYSPLKKTEVLHE